MPTQTVSRAKRPLEIDACSCPPSSDRRPLERREDCRRVEPPRPEFTHSETRAIHGDTFTADKIVEWSTNAKLAPGFRLPNAFHLANLLDQSSKHSTLAERVLPHYIFAKFCAAHHAGALQLLFQRVGQLVERAQTARA